MIDELTLAAIRENHKRCASWIESVLGGPDGYVQQAHADRAALLAELDEMRAENERLRMQLAACGVIAMSNTRESAKKARAMRPEYWCASVGEVEAAVDREMALMERERALRSAAQEYLQTLGAAMKSGKFEMGGTAEMAHFVRQAMQKLDSLVFDRKGPRPAGLEKLHEPIKGAS